MYSHLKIALDVVIVNSSFLQLASHYYLYFTFSLCQSISEKGHTLFECNKDY